MLRTAFVPAKCSILNPSTSSPVSLGKMMARSCLGPKKQHKLSDKEKSVGKLTTKRRRDVFQKNDAHVLSLFT